MQALKLEENKQMKIANLRLKQAKNRNLLRHNDLRALKGNGFADDISTYSSMTYVKPAPTILEGFFYRQAEVRESSLATPCQFTTYRLGSQKMRPGYEGIETRT